MMTISECAERVVTEAGEAGGRDEVKQIARKGWRGDVVVVVLNSHEYEDHDDSLAVALGDVAEHMGLATWELTAEWDDAEQRDHIIVRSSARELLDAIQDEAASRTAVG